MVFFMITMYFSGGMIPGYLNIQSLGLLDTRSVILVNGLVSTFNLIVARTYFLTAIPWEIQEAAVIDGCNDFFQVLGKIFFPLSKAITVVMVLYYGIGRWNSYFTEMIYLKDRAKYPLQFLAGDFDEKYLCKDSHGGWSQFFRRGDDGAHQAGGYGKYAEIRCDCTFHSADVDYLSVFTEIF